MLRNAGFRFAVVAAGALLGCGGRLGGEDGQPPARCVPGRQVDCACPGDAVGEQVCGPDGTYGACMCAEGNGEAGAGVDVTP